MSNCIILEKEYSSLTPTMVSDGGQLSLPSLSYGNSQVSRNLALFFFLGFGPLVRNANIVGCFFHVFTSSFSFYHAKEGATFSIPIPQVGEVSPSSICPLIDLCIAQLGLKFRLLRANWTPAIFNVVEIPIPIYIHYHIFSYSYPFV